MKLKNFLNASFLLYCISSFSQNVASTATLTSGGFDAGVNGQGTYYGYQSGKYSSGESNTFYGYQSGRDNMTGSFNTYLGSLSGTTNTGASYNTYVGYHSGNLSSGNQNTYLGVEAGRENVGSNNTFIGYQAGAESLGSGNIFIGNTAGFSNSGDNKLIIENYDTNPPLIWGDFVLDQLKLNAKVGIGNSFGNFPTTAGSVDVSNYNLFVKGGILTEEVRVNLQSDWADYVFHKNYNLKPLEEVETFIKENGHLENVPSAKQVKENGIELGEIAKIQQEKIEELTLYLIEINKENKILQKKLLELEEKINNSNSKN